MRYRTPEGRTWAKIAESFFLGTPCAGLCREEATQGTDLMWDSSYTIDSPVALYCEPGQVLYPSRRWEEKRFKHHHNISRMWIALMIAAMCETGDAYR